MCSQRMYQTAGETRCRARPESVYPGAFLSGPLVARRYFFSYFLSFFSRFVVVWSCAKVEAPLLVCTFRQIRFSRSPCWPSAGQKARPTEWIGPIRRHVRVASSGRCTKLRHPRPRPARRMLQNTALPSVADLVEPAARPCRYEDSSIIYVCTYLSSILLAAALLVDDAHLRKVLVGAKTAGGNKANSLRQQWPTTAGAAVEGASNVPPWTGLENRKTAVTTGKPPAPANLRWPILNQPTPRFFLYFFPSLFFLFFLFFPCSACPSSKTKKGQAPPRHWGHSSADRTSLQAPGASDDRSRGVAAAKTRDLQRAAVKSSKIVKIVSTHRMHCGVLKRGKKLRNKKRKKKKKKQGKQGLLLSLAFTCLLFRRVIPLGPAAFNHLLLVPAISKKKQDDPAFRSGICKIVDTDQGGKSYRINLPRA